ncbi:transposase [Streptomyces sp. HUCO-GS316]|uniref:Helicase associated domain protein n=1 Tax=Streptomyces sp. HUCO-GS316 TaxID=2692198 RepID=UPI0013711314|nr:transposase [Streptomyces sp. HUCO-GS316]
MVAVGAAPDEVFALARAVVCRWWELEAFWQRERAWGPRLEQVVAATGRWDVQPAGWGVEQWRLLARDVVVFPEVVAVAAALVDGRVQQAAGAAGSGGLLRAGGQGGVERCAVVLGERLGRVWLGEVEAERSAGPLASWVQAVVREQRRGAEAPPQRGQYGLWWVRSSHRPVDVGRGLRLLAERPDGGGGDGAVGGWRAQWAVPRRVGHGRGLERWRAQLFAQGLKEARAHAERFGNLAVAHTDNRAGDGFDLGRWLANRRAKAAWLTAGQAAQLEELDPWWNPPWPLDWQRAWYRARAYVTVHGPVDGGDNLNGLPSRLERWLRHQLTHYQQLHEGQQRLLTDLGLDAGEAERFHAWAGRRRPAADGLAVARAYTARHGHLAVSRPTTLDGFALGTWLNNARIRQRAAGRPTRLGRQLAAVDAWWNPPWPVAWQRTWQACRFHLTGLPDGVMWWPGAPGAEHTFAWLQEQAARRPLLHPGQQRLVDELLPVAGPLLKWRPRISDTAWQTLSPLLPARTHTGGHRPRCERQILEAIVHVAVTGRSWRRLPSVLGDFIVCRRRFLRWQQDGTLHQVAAARLPETDTRWQQQLAAYIRAMA